MDWLLINRRWSWVSTVSDTRSKHGCVSAVWGPYSEWVTVCFRFICEPYWIDSWVTAAQFGWWKEDRSFSIIAICNSCAARSFMMPIDWTQIRERISLRALKRDLTVNLFVLFNVNLSPLWLSLCMEQGEIRKGEMEITFWQELNGFDIVNEMMITNCWEILTK